MTADARGRPAVQHPDRSAGARLGAIGRGGVPLWVAGGGTDPGDAWATLATWASYSRFGFRFITRPKSRTMRAKRKKTFES